MVKEVKIVVRDQKAGLGLNAFETEKLERNLLLELTAELNLSNTTADAQEIFKGEQPLDMDESAMMSTVEEHYKMVNLSVDKEKQRKLEDAISTIEGIVHRRERKITNYKKRDGDRVRAKQRATEVEEIMNILEIEVE